MPKLAPDRGRIARAGQEVQLVVAELGDRGAGEPGPDAGAGRLGIRPERQAQIDVVGDQLAGRLGVVGREQRRDPGLLGRQADRIEVEDPGRIEGAPVDLLGREQHVGRRVPIEQEVALAISPQADEGQRRARPGIEPERPDVDALLGQRVGQEMAERVLADLAHEGAGHAQAHQPDGDIGGRPARRLLERLDLGQLLAAHGRHEVDQQVAEAHHVSHGRDPSFHTPRCRSR